MTSSSALPPKKEVALALLERATLFMHLDPRGDDVSVPPWFKKQPQLVLQVGLNMPVPIRDLNVDDQGVSCTLSFSRSPHFCVVPWTAVYALVGEDGRGMVWPDDVPSEVMVQAKAPKQRPAIAAVPDRPRTAKKKKRRQRSPGHRHLSSPKAASLDEGGARTQSEPEPSDGSRSKRPLPPYLRIVK